MLASTGKEEEFSELTSTIIVSSISSAFGIDGDLTINSKLKTFCSDWMETSWKSVIQESKVLIINDHMTFPAWIRQIKPESCIQAIIPGHFVHTTINDCILVGHHSLRLLILQDSEIIVTAHYDHPSKISSAALVIHEGEPKICFISNSQLFFAKVLSNSIQITHSCSISPDFKFIASGNNLLCLYSTDPHIGIGNQDSLQFDDIATQGKTVWSCCVVKDRLFVLDLSNLFYVTLYSYSPESGARVVQKFQLPFLNAFKLVPFNNSCYILCDRQIYRIQESEDLSRSWHFDNFGDKKLLGSDMSLIVDAAQIGSIILLLTGSGDIISFDGINFSSFSTGHVSATLIAAFTISRILLVNDSGSLQLYDRDMNLQSQIISPIYRSASYNHGMYVVASQHSISIADYSYGIEVEKVTQIKYKRAPKITSVSNSFFLLFEDRLVILDSQFKDITPARLRLPVYYDRIEAETAFSFFGITQDEVVFYDSDSTTHYPIQSTLSLFENGDLFVSNCFTMEKYSLVHGVLVKQNEATFKSQISAISSGCVALFDGNIHFLDSELQVTKTVNFDNRLIISIAKFQNGFAYGTADGHFLTKSEDIALGVSSLSLFSCSENSVAINSLNSKGGSRLFYKVDSVVKAMPPDFINFLPCEDGTFCAIVRSGNRSHNFIKFRFTDQSVGFCHSLLCETNYNVFRVAAGSSNDFSAVLTSPLPLREQTVYFSNNDQKFKLNKNERVRSLWNWKTNKMNLWVVMTRPVNFEREFGALYFLTHDSATGKIRQLLRKSYSKNGYVVGFAPLGSKLAVTVQEQVAMTIFINEKGLQTAHNTRDFPLSDPIDVAASHDFVAILTEKNGFFVMTPELTVQTVVKRSLLGGRIAIANDKVVVSDRGFGLFLFSAISGELTNSITLVAPVSSISTKHDTAIVSLVTGELVLVNTNGNVVTDTDVSSFFSFGGNVINL